MQVGLPDALPPLPHLRSRPAYSYTSLSYPCSFHSSFAFPEAPISLQFCTVPNRHRAIHARDCQPKRRGTANICGTRVARPRGPIRRGYVAASNVPKTRLARFTSRAHRHGDPRSRSDSMLTFRRADLGGRADLRSPQIPLGHCLPSCLQDEVVG